MTQIPTSHINVLIVDDHPMTVDGYVALISSCETTADTKFHLAYDIRQAFNTLAGFSESGISPDVAFLDVSLPPFEEQDLHSGIDLALLIRLRHPLCKIVIITMHCEPVWVNQILKSVNPEGFISKSEINYRTFPAAYHKIMDGDFQYSSSITKAHRLFLSKNIDWDEYDSKILKLLSEGKKMINLPEYVGLSLSTIEKRKANLKKQLVLDGQSDQELLIVAKNFGLL